MSMPPNEAESPDESFFNDLSQQLQEPNIAHDQETHQDGSSKLKRIACVLCRKRKLRCDGARPSCSTCKRLSHDCAYDQVRKKSGPKRGYVKLLEQRLQQVETLLKTQDANDTSKDATRQDSASEYVANTINLTLPSTNHIPNFATPQHDTEQRMAGDIIGLGLEEPLPPQEVIDNLYEVYFSKVHLSIPVIHRPRFLAALNLAPHMRPPICLRYIMWAMAASVSNKYEALHEHFYQRARKYAQMDEMKGHGETTITLAHCQSWILICTYEFKNMYFPRAWLSAGRAVRLAQMMQLHRLDGLGLDVKQCLPQPKDWTEREERRRTFWMAFCVDRYASIGTGWPMVIDERDILTNLPASEEAFEKSRPMSTVSLERAMQPNGVANLQPSGGIVLTAAMFGRNLLHLHRPGPDDRDDDINGGYWSRHRDIEQLLLQTSLGLPDHMRLPSGLSDPNVVFTNMCIHTSAICLHQAAIFKADKHRLPVNIANESKIRCVTAAAEIASLMRMISHMDLSAMNPFISFCVYVAARVFVQYLKTRPKDQQMAASLKFLMQAMHALRRKNPLTESFLAQLDIDIEHAGTEGLQQMKSMTKPTATRGATNQFRCNPIINISEGQQLDECVNIVENNSRVNTTSTRSTQYANNAPGPPFHVSSINNNIDLRTAPHVSSREALATTGSHGSTPGWFAAQDGNEMDLSGGERSLDHDSPVTISSQSRGGSTSQSSYSPGQQNELHMPYRASPKVTYSNLAPNGSTVFPGFVSTNDAFSMNTFDTSGDMGSTGYNDGIIMGNEWDYAALNAGSGLPVMADASWDSMLESVTTGWESVSQVHDSQANIFSAR